jgi:hypothetical protein
VSRHLCSGTWIPVNPNRGYGMSPKELADLVPATSQPHTLGPRRHSCKCRRGSSTSPRTRSTPRPRCVRATCAGTPRDKRLNGPLDWTGRHHEQLPQMSGGVRRQLSAHLGRIGRLEAGQLSGAVGILGPVEAAGAPVGGRGPAALRAASIR